MGGKARLILGCLIGAVFLYLAFRKVDFGQMGQTFRGANYWYMLLILVWIFISHYLRVLRWRYLLDPIRRLDVKILFSSLLIGYMANAVTPAHLGELLRAYVLGKKRGVSASSALATIVMERIIDLLAFVCVMVTAVLLYPFPGWVKKAGYVMLFATLGLFIALVLLKKNYDKFMPVLDFLLKPFSSSLREKWKDLVGRFVAGIVPLRSPTDYVVVAILSVLIWVCYGLIYHLSLAAFHFHELYHLTWLASLTLLVITTIGIIVPSSPGYVGTYHYLCQVSLALFAVPASPALSFATALHAINFIPVVVAGLIFAYYEGIGILSSPGKLQEPLTPADQR